MLLSLWRWRFLLGSSPKHTDQAALLLLLEWGQGLWPMGGPFSFCAFFVPD